MKFPAEGVHNFSEYVALKDDYVGNLLMAFFVKDYKERTYTCIASEINGELYYYFGGHKPNVTLVPRNLFKIALERKDNEWIYLACGSVKRLSAELMLEEL